MITSVNSRSSANGEHASKQFALSLARNCWFVSARPCWQCWQLRQVSGQHFVKRFGEFGGVLVVRRMQEHIRSQTAIDPISDLGSPFLDPGLCGGDVVAADESQHRSLTRYGVAERTIGFALLGFGFMMIGGRC